MTTDKFVKRNRLISQHMEMIANRRSGNSTHSLVPTTPAYRDLLVAQERLLLAAERMLDSRDGAIAA